MDILIMKHVDYFYKDKKVKVSILENCSYSFEKGVLYAIVGPSGSGKTTTLSLLGALDKTKGGKILFDGKTLEKIGYCNYRNQNVGIVFQSYNLLDYLTVIQNVMSVMDISKEKIENKAGRAAMLLERVGIKREQLQPMLRLFWRTSRQVIWTKRRPEISFTFFKN